MATTTNYGWVTPNNTDLVKDGAAAIRTLGSSVDTTVFNNASAAIAKTIVDAKGDIIAATAADTVARLAVGANNTILVADSSTATGLKWAAPAGGGGKVLQVVQGTKLDTASTTSTSFQASGVSVSITPSAATSKILILSQVNVGANPVNAQPYLQLFRAGLVTTFIGDTAGSRPRVTSQGAPSANNYFMMTLPITFLDSPATTSATTYEVYFRSSQGSAVYINRSDVDENGANFSPRGASSIIALEIGA